MEKEQTTHIPNSNNLAEIASEMGKLNEFTSKLAPMIVEWSKIVKTFGKIDTKELTTNANNVRNIAKSINGFVDSIGVVMDGLKKLDAGISIGDLATLREKLLTSESGGDVIITKNIESKGNASLDLTKEITKAKISKPGLIDIVAQVATLSGTMASIHFVDPIKFKLKFNQTISLFKWQYKKLVKFSDAFDIKTIRTIKFATDGLQEVMMGLPTCVFAMADLFSKHGTIKERVLINRGIKTLLGKNMDGLGGLVYSTLLLGEQLNSKTLNLQDIDNFSKSIEPLSKALRTMMRTITLAALLSPLMKIGLLVLFGRKGDGGVIRLMITGLEWVGEKTKNIKNATLALLYIAGAIALLSLAAVMTALTGILLIMAWPAILITMSFITVLVGAFMLIGLASNWIHEGGEELFYVAATVGILALVAITMALTGQFIQASWDAMIITIIYMTVLVGAFIAVGWAASWIRAGGKELFYIAATVGILALTAVVLVLLGQYLEANWDSLWAVTLMITGLVGMLLGIGFVTKQLNESQKGFWQLIVCVGMMTLVVVILAMISENYDILKILGLVGIMTGLIVAVGGIAIAAGLLLMGPAGVAFAAGKIALLSIIGICALIGGVALMLAKTAKIIESTGFNDSKQLANMINLPFKALVEGDEDGDNIFKLFTKLPNPVKLGIMMMKLTGLTIMAVEIGKMADILQHIASLNMPIEWDEKGKPTRFKQMEEQDFIDAGVNAASILQFFAAVFDDKKKKLPNGVIVGGAMGGIKNIEFGVAIKVRRLRKVVKHIGKMASTLQHIASLNIPTGFDDKGNPKSFRPMSINDFMTAAMNAGSILTFFAGLFEDKPATIMVMGKNIQLGKIAGTNKLAGLENVSRKMKRRVKRLSTIVACVGQMADTIQKLAVLNIPDEIDERTGEVKKWRMMQTGDFETASQNIATIMTTIVGAMTSDDLAERLNNMSRRATKNFERVMGSMSGVQGIIDLIKMVTGGMVPTKFIKDEDKDSATYGQIIPDPNSYINIMEYISSPTNSKTMSKNIGLLFGTVVNAFSGMDEGGFLGVGKNDAGKKLKNAAKSMDDIQKVIAGAVQCTESIMSLYDNKLANLNSEEFQSRYRTATGIIGSMVDTFGGKNVNLTNAKQLQVNIKESTAFVTKVNSIDIEKLKTVETLFKHISDLSKSINGNFEGLADLLNEKLLKILEKIVGKLEHMGESVPESKPTTPGDVIKTQSGSANAKNVVDKKQNKPDTGKLEEIRREINDIKGILNNITTSSGGMNRIRVDTGVGI